MNRKNPDLVRIDIFYPIIPENINILSEITVNPNHLYESKTNTKKLKPNKTKFKRTPDKQELQHSKNPPFKRSKKNVK